MFLFVFFQSAYYLAWTSGCHNIAGNVTIYKAACSNNCVISYFNVWQNCCSGANETIFSNINCSINDGFFILIGQVAQNSCCRIMGDKCNIKADCAVVAYTY